MECGDEKVDPCNSTLDARRFYSAKSVYSSAEWSSSPPCGLFCLSNKCVVHVFGAYALLCFRCALLRCPTRQHCRSFLAWIKLQLPDKRKCFLVLELLLLLLSGISIFPASQRIDLLLNELRNTHTY